MLCKKMKAAMRLFQNQKRQALFGLIPGLKLLVKALDEIVCDIIAKALYAYMLDAQHRLNRHLIGAIAVTDDGA